MMYENYFFLVDSIMTFDLWLWPWHLLNNNGSALSKSMTIMVFFSGWVNRFVNFIALQVYRKTNHSFNSPKMTLVRDYFSQNVITSIKKEVGLLGRGVKRISFGCLSYKQFDPDCWLRSGFESLRRQLGFKPLSGSRQLRTLNCRATLKCASFGG